MRTLFVTLFWVVLSLSLLSSSSKTNNSSLSIFEKRYIEQQKQASNIKKNQILLIGMTRLSYTGDDAIQFRDVLRDNKQDIVSLDNCFIKDKGDSIVIMIFFPLKEARISCNKRELIADEKGLITPTSSLKLEAVKLVGDRNREWEPISSKKVYKSRKAIIFRLQDISLPM